MSRSDAATERMPNSLAVADAQSADAVWREAAKWFTQAGRFSRQRSRAGETLEILHAILHIRNPRLRWVFSRRPAINPAFAMVEACWILAGRNDAALPRFFNRRLSRFVGEGEVITGAYGERLRGGGFDQLDLAAKALGENHDTRQVVLQLYSGSRDFPTTGGKPRHEDVPCNVTSLLKIRHGKLEWTQIVRSNDLMLGVPYNFIQFTILQEVLAGWIGVEVGSYFQLSDSLHVYTRHDKLLVESLAKSRIIQRGGMNASCDPLYSWGMPRSEFSAVFPELMRRLDLIASSRSKIGDNNLTLNDLPAPFLDVVYVASAEAARKRKDSVLAAELGSRIVDPGLGTLWDCWATDRASLVPFPSIEQGKARGFD